MKEIRVFSCIKFIAIGKMIVYNKLNACMKLFCTQEAMAVSFINKKRIGLVMSSF